jgi:hypothetical protein
MLHTARADGLKIARTDEPRALVPVPAPAEAADGALREWCESRGHPCGRLADGECICGLIRYDD